MRRILSLVTKIILLVVCCWGTQALADDQAVSVPVLVYHRFDPTVPGSMTINTAKFAAQMQWLKDNHYTVIPLKTLVDYLLGKGAPPPPKSVVITADDGRDSVYKYMFPVIRKYNYPVTLFIYPSAISNASYALTWEQLQEMRQTGLFDIQGHTYWHPNFKQEKKKLTPEEYQKLVEIQLVKSKERLEKKLGIQVTLLAWPYGIYDDYLEQQAAKAGYLMAFSIDGRNTKKTDNAMAQPRYMIVQSESMADFAAIIEGHAQGKSKGTEA